VIGSALDVPPKASDRCVFGTYNTQKKNFIEFNDIFIMGVKEIFWQIHLMHQYSAMRHCLH